MVEGESGGFAGGGGSHSGCAGDSRRGGGGSNKRSSSSLPEQMEGVPMSNPPPFLTKIYEIVDDKETDSIVGWSPCGTSFIILDNHRFSIEILPKYFRHNNFSSFIYQLNNYGFRKISENWEYWNEWFQAGKKHLLKKIKRRKQKAQVIAKQTTKVSCTDPRKLRLEAELKELRNHHNKLKVEMAKLEENQENTKKQFIIFQQNMERIASKYQKIVILMANAFYQTFSQQFVQKLKENREAVDDGESSKRRKIDLNEPQSSEESMDPTNTIHIPSQTTSGKDQSRQGEEASGEEGKVNAITGMEFTALGSERFMLIAKQMEDVLMCEDDNEGEMAVYRSEIDKEWEALVQYP